MVPQNTLLHCRAISGYLAYSFLPILWTARTFDRMLRENRNEPPIPYIPPAWLIKLRNELDGSGYSRTQIIAPDASSTGSQVVHLLEQMLAMPKLANAVDVIGTHGYWTTPPSDFSRLAARNPKNGKRAWVSESWHQMGTWNG